MLYAIIRNIMKYHRFVHQEIEKYEGKKGAEGSVDKEVLPEIQTRGFCALKQLLLKEGDSPVKIQSFEKA